MMRELIVSRNTLSLGVSACIGTAAFHRMPFPADNALLHLVLWRTPHVFCGLKYAYTAMLFSTPYIGCSVLLSLVYIFVLRQEKSIGLRKLPTYPEPAGRSEMFLVLGEQHHPRQPEPVENPSWLTIPERGLYTGIAVFGAIGTGKTTGCMYPFAEQLLAYRAVEKEKRIGALILEVKGDFCHKVNKMLKGLGRGEDYIEISLDSPYRYNPLHNDLEAYALAYGIASLLNNLYGKGKEPFWQQAYTNLVKFIILLHKILYDYVTLFDVYECAINPELLERKITDGERAFQAEYVLIGLEDFMEHPDLERFPFERDSAVNRMKVPWTDALKRTLDENKIDYEIQVENPAAPAVRPIRDDDKRDQFEAVKRWFYHDWKRIEPRLRTSIVEGISVFLSLFDDNPTVKRIFCPPKETYDPIANQDGHCGKPLPAFSELIETGAVVALNFPVATNPGLAKTIGTFMKQDFQRAVLTRIPRIEKDPNKFGRQVLFLCDEYQAFATAGENDPSGDEKFFALSRQGKCISIVSTQSISSLRSTLPGESWRTLLQTFRTKIFLSLSDDFSARTASELCGKEEMLKVNYSISENGLDAGVSILSGLASAQRATLSTSKSYNVHRDFTFEPKIFSELKNAQSIVLAYDGLNPLAPRYCYLKPYYLDRNTSYFEQVANGDL
jgi:hypothetical protein